MRAQYGAFNSALRNLYGNDNIIRLAAKEVFGGQKPFDFDDSLFDDVASLVYRNGGFDISQLEDPAARAVICETLRVLNTAIDSSLPHEVPETVRYALENNAFIFSGFKTFHSMREIGLSMVTDNGDIKPFNDFMVEVKKINQMYNHNYLRAEYYHAVGTSLMAARWHDFEQDGDRYNLQYRTANDGHVREEHAILHNTTLPPSDPFWDKYLPPNGWGCRCTVAQVLKDDFKVSDSDLAMKRGDNCTAGVKQQIFRYNPGKSLQLFPPKHPYFKTPTDAKKAIEGNLTEMYNNGIGGHVPPSLNTQEQKAWIENEHALADTITEQGKPMTHEEANEHHANPNYRKGVHNGYSQNCQSCVVAYELRRRGYDVEAFMRVVGDANNVPEKLAYHTELAWRVPGTNEIPKKVIAGGIKSRDVDKRGRVITKTKSLSELNAELNELTKEPGRYHINWTWKGRGTGHIVTCEKFANGGIRIYDPQTGEIFKWSEIANDIKLDKGVGVLRVDNLIINMDVINGIVKPK